ncbi:MAG: YkgJ family cysteine cluster protein [Candidatus Brocadiales bacterium]
MRGLRFECQRCGVCCQGEPGYVWVTIEEIKKIANHVGISLDEFGKKYVRKVGARYSLLEFANGDCVMYDNGCKIYPVRPCQCATFPFWPNILQTPADWEKITQLCPSVSNGSLYSQKEIQNIVEVQQRYESQR